MVADISAGGRYIPRVDALVGDSGVTGDRFRDRFDQGAMCWMNRIAGIAIGGFGVVTFLIGVKHGR